MTTQIIFAIFAIAIVALFFFNRSAAKKYKDNHVEIIHDLNETDLEVEAYVAEYETMDSETLLALSKSPLSEKRHKAAARVLTQRDMTQAVNSGTF
ncbi:hypothetical protein [Flavobacterium sp.]|uniref:hypothetical protein n=1 Tax=Flavobacterium sp. TaxID=239 RepID=UPI001206ED94|nr:hypothetical protein [Flavobacterium sp.]RZJ73189.1 MAG: hypothetical protein EOO49_02465 [Flavobacterium sp.]